jgi:integrase
MSAHKRKKAANGEGSVTWSKSYRRWVGQATLRRPGQPPVRKKVYGPPGADSSAARKIVEHKLAQYIGPERAGDATAPLKAFLDEYASRSKLASNTRSFYAMLVESYLDRLGAKPLGDVKPRDIETALDAVGDKPRTRQALYKMLNGVFKQAVRHDMIWRNPVQNVDPPSYRREDKERAFTMRELGFILEAARRTRLEALLILLLETGMRPAEAYGLQRSDLNLAERELWVRRGVIANKETGFKPQVAPTTKTKRVRRVELSAQTVAVLRDHLKRSLAAGNATSDFVFTSDEGHLIRHSNLIRRWWRPLLKEAQIEAEKAARAAGDDDYRFPVSRPLYSLRHSSDEVAALSGVGYDLISARMGHTTLATTFTHYLNVSEDRERQAADKIGSFIEGLRKHG